PAVEAQGGEELVLGDLRRLAPLPGQFGHSRDRRFDGHAAVRGAGVLTEEALYLRTGFEDGQTAAADDELPRHVAELADVARPVVAGQPGHQVRAQPE